MVMQSILLDAGITANAVVWIDDVLIFTNTYEEHCTVLKKLFAAMDKVTMKLHPGKSRLFFDIIEYLGVNISVDGISLVRLRLQLLEHCQLLRTCMS